MEQLKTELAPESKPEDVTPIKELELLVKKRKEVGLELSEEVRAKKLKKQIDYVLKQQGKFQKMLVQYQETAKKGQSCVMSQVKVAASVLGNETFKMLKNIFRVEVPEEKDENGVVIRKATSYINYKPLLNEARLAIVLQRDSRIKSGKRKRTTGRSSDRRIHSTTLGFIYRRNKEELAQSTATKKE